MTRTTHIDDSLSGETKDYSFVAKKCEDHVWGNGGGIAWEEYLSIDAVHKTTKKTLMKNSASITTRDRYNSQYDLHDRWSYDYVKINVLDNDKNIIEIMAVDNKGKPYLTGCSDAFYMKLNLDELVK